MNEWLLAALALVIAGLGPCLFVCVASPAIEGLIALELAGVIAAVVLLLLAEGLHRQPFVDLGVVLAAVSFVGALAFARFLEREA